VIGIDMTPEMIDRARSAAARGGYGNVEFRLGEIESLPVADGAADAVISNCVINLSPDKPRVFREAFRALKPGGRLLVSDIVLRGELPEKLRQSVELWAGCLAGAMQEEDYLGAIRAAGFAGVEVVSARQAGDLLAGKDGAQLTAEAPDLSSEELRRLGGMVVSVEVKATKPARG
jgi:SAM-dependent methyltransferase